MSNTSANRWTDDVPMIIPEINSDHLDIIQKQQKKRNFPKNGFVVSKSNCSIQSFLVAIDALNKSGFNVNKINVTTMQALSGGGIKIINDKNYQNNLIPFINGEEEKTENEPLKIFGKVQYNKIIKSKNLSINAFCSRVPIIDGHSAVVQLQFDNKVPKISEILHIWENYKSIPQFLKLPTAPEFPIKYLYEELNTTNIKMWSPYKLRSWIKIEKLNWNTLSENPYEIDVGQPSAKTIDLCLKLI